MTEALDLIKLGRIGYVNMAPVFFRLDAAVEEIVGVPTDLNRRLVSGELDVAPISSIEYARNAETLRLLPRLCVSSEGAVESIQLISKTPLQHIRTVAVTPESATSVVLTKVLFPDAEQVPLGEDAEAKLLIGDAALRSAFEDPTPHHDLGRLWLERTGLPMVFAVWAAPEPTHPGLVELEDALVESVRAARSDPELLAYESAELYGYPAGFLARYFEKLRYRFGPRERAGLYTFLELARDVGELDEVPELRYVAATRSPVGLNLTSADDPAESGRLSRETNCTSSSTRSPLCSPTASPAAHPSVTSSRSDTTTPAPPSRTGPPRSSAAGA